MKVSNKNVVYGFMKKNKGKCMLGRFFFFHGPAIFFFAIEFGGSHGR